MREYESWGNPEFLASRQDTLESYLNQMWVNAVNEGNLTLLGNLAKALNDNNHFKVYLRGTGFHNDDDDFPFTSSLLMSAKTELEENCLMRIYDDYKDDSPYFGLMGYVNSNVGKDIKVEDSNFLFGALIGDGGQIGSLQNDAGRGALISERGFVGSLVNSHYSPGSEIAIRGGGVIGEVSNSSLVILEKSVVYIGGKEYRKKDHKIFLKFDGDGKVLESKIV